jgi:T5SS/PEP-CTERM-associated repeat protein
MSQPRHRRAASCAGACLTAIILLSHAIVATAASDVWDGAGAIPPNGIWGTDVNWVDNTTPGNGDTATFNVANTYNVTFDANPAAIQALSASAGNVTFASSGGAQALAVNSGGGQDATVNGGATLSLGTSGNPLHLTVGDDLIVNGNGTLNVSFGSQVNTLDLTAQASLGNATIVVDGTGSALNRTGTGQRAFGNSNGTTSLTYRNNATGDHNDSLIVGNISDVTGTANLNVESNADLTLDSLTLGFGAAAGPTGIVTVTGGGSTITQSGASTLTIGRANGNSGQLNVNSSRVFNTGTGAIALNATGSINIGGGTFNANSNLTMASGSILNFNGGTLNPNAGINIGAGATFNFNNGQMTVDSGESVTSAGAFTIGSTGVGTLNIEDQGVVHVGTTLAINSTSNINLNGGTLRFNLASGLERMNYNFGTIQLARNAIIGNDYAIDTLFLIGSSTYILSGRALIIEGSTTIRENLEIDQGSLTTQNITFDSPGTRMIIREGGTVTSHGFVHFNSSDCNVFISGIGSSWTSNHILQVGYGVTNTTIRIEDHALFAPRYIDFGPHAALILDGGTLRLESYLRNSDNGSITFIAGTLQLGVYNIRVGEDDAIEDFFGPVPLITAGKGLIVEETATLTTAVTLDGGTFSVGRLVNGHNLHFQRGTLDITNQAVTSGASNLARPLAAARDRV